MRNYKVRVSYKAKDDDAEALKELAAALNCNQSEAIRRAVVMARDWLKEERK